MLGGGLLINLGGFGITFQARLVRGLERLKEEAAAGESKNQVFSFLARFSPGGGM